MEKKQLAIESRKLFFKALGRCVYAKKQKVKPVELIDGLYLGSRFDIKKIEELSIRKVVNLNQKIKYPKCVEDVYFIRSLDLPSFNMAKFFDSAFDYINRALENGEKVLVHCYGGISRSATICAAFLIRKMGWSADKTIEYIQERRCKALPNPGFIKQLLSYQSKLQKESKS